MCEGLTEKKTKGTKEIDCDRKRKGKKLFERERKSMWQSCS